MGKDGEMRSSGECLCERGDEYAEYMQRDFLIPIDLFSRRLVRPKYTPPPDVVPHACSG